MYIDFYLYTEMTTYIVGKNWLDIQVKHWFHDGQNWKYYGQHWDRWKTSNSTWNIITGKELFPLQVIQLLNFFGSSEIDQGGPYNKDQ